MNFIKLTFLIILLNITPLFSFLETSLYDLERVLSTLKEALEYSPLIKKVEEKVGFELFESKKQLVIDALNNLVNNPGQQAYDNLKSALDNFKTECWKLNKKYKWLKEGVQAYLQVDQQIANKISAEIMNNIDEEKKQLDNQFTLIYEAKKELWSSIKLTVKVSHSYFSQGELVTSTTPYAMSLNEAFLKLREILKDCFAISVS